MLNLSIPMRGSEQFDFRDVVQSKLENLGQVILLALPSFAQSQF